MKLVFQMLFILSLIWVLVCLAAFTYLSVCFFHPQWFEPGTELDVVPYFFSSVVLLFLSMPGAVICRMTRPGRPATRYRSFRLKF